MRNVIDLMRNWSGSKHSDKYTFNFNKFLRIVRYYQIFNSYCVQTYDCKINIVKFRNQMYNADYNYGLSKKIIHDM